MPEYAYAARTLAGERVSGSLIAPNREAASRALVGDRNLNVLRLDEQRSGFQRLDSFVSVFAWCWWGLWISSARLLFFRSMRYFIKYNVPLERALALTMESCPNPRLREALRSVLVDVADAHASLASAIAAHRGEFPDYQIAMLEATNETALAFTFEQIVDLEEFDVSRGKRLQAAFAYPAFIALGIAALLVFMSTRFLPKFEELAQRIPHAKVPQNLIILGAIGDVFRNPVYLTAGLLAIAALIWAWQALMRRPRAAFEFHRLLNRVPLLGRYRYMEATTLLSRFLGAMLATGVPIEVALVKIAGMTRDVFYADAVRRAAHNLETERAKNIPDALEATGVFTPEYIALIRAGQESSATVETLQTLAKDYAGDLGRMLEVLIKYIEPLMLVLLGFIVGFVIITVLTSLYSLYLQIGR